MKKLLRLKSASMMLFWFGVGILIHMVLLILSQYYLHGYSQFLTPHPSDNLFNAGYFIYYLGHFIHIFSGYWLSKGKKIGLILGLGISVYEIVSFFVPTVSPNLLTPTGIAFRVLFGIVTVLIILGRKDLPKLQTENWRPWKNPRAKIVKKL